ncbi:MAG: dual OB domain-containing protein, partial [Pseudonocardiaceae bacterium]
MSTVKCIVCLANSRKLNGRCIAGKELVKGRPAQWIRPVSSRDHQEVSEYERQYKDGTDPENLDIIDIPLLDAHPQEYQQENWLLDPNQYWSKVERFQFDKLSE